MELFKKDASFSYVNGRGYVHSSSIIEYIWLSVKSHFSSQNDQEIYIDIRFHQVLEANAKFIVFDEFQDFSKDKNIVSEGVVYTKQIKLYFYLFEDTGRDVVENDNFEYCVDMDSTGNYEGLCVISINNITSYIGNIIESNKRVHKITQCNNSKLEIINLYMKKFPLQIADKNFEKITLLIENIGVREHKSDITTLNRIKFLEFPGMQFDFAFLVKEIVRE